MWNFFSKNAYFSSYDKNYFNQKLHNCEGGTILKERFKDKPVAKSMRQKGWSISHVPILNTLEKIAISIIMSNLGQFYHYYRIIKFQIWKSFCTFLTQIRLMNYRKPHFVPCLIIELMVSQVSFDIISCAFKFGIRIFSFWPSNHNC